MIVIGTDTHKRTHALAAVDEGTGRVCGHREIAADEDGHLAAVRWARGLDTERVWAIEDCRQVSRRLEQALIAAGERVVRVAPHRMGVSRRGERQPGKSDQIDSLAIARAVVKDGVDRFPAAYLDERAMEIRLISDHRHDLVAERTRVQNRFRWHLVTLDPELEASHQARLAVGLAPARSNRPTAAAAARRRQSPGRARPGLTDPLAQPPGQPTQGRAADADHATSTTAARRDRLRSADRRDPDRPHRRRSTIRDRRELRVTERHRADQVLLRPTRPTPTQPWWRPTAQPRAAHHRDHPRPAPPQNPRLPRPQTSRRKDHQGRAAMPQTTPRQTLSPPPRRARQPTTTRHDSHRRDRSNPHAMHSMNANPLTQEQASRGQAAVWLSRRPAARSRADRQPGCKPRTRQRGGRLRQSSSKRTGRPAVAFASLGRCCLTATRSSRRTRTGSTATRFAGRMVCIGTNAPAVTAVNEPGQHNRVKPSALRGPRQAARRCCFGRIGRAPCGARPS